MNIEHQFVFAIDMPYGHMQTRLAPVLKKGALFGLYDSRVRSSVSSVWNRSANTIPPSSVHPRGPDPMA